ncbi:MAG: redox-sensing transcriptional repressor Rex, partial [Clostridia bacterium]|nr:redox-sensing transcriptional repressor Rex [Clostridia bacterium]
AVLALRAATAPEMLRRLRELGFRAGWTRSPVDLQPPRELAVARWPLHDTLQILSYRINRMEEELSRR